MSGVKRADGRRGNTAVKDRPQFDDEWAGAGPIVPRGNCEKRILVICICLKDYMLFVVVSQIGGQQNTCARTLCKVGFFSMSCDCLLGVLMLLFG